jgi:hypothetical protein
MNDNLDEAFQTLQREVTATVRPLPLAELELRAHRRHAQQVLTAAAAAVAVVGLGVGTWAAQATTSRAPVVGPASTPPPSSTPSTPTSTTARAGTATPTQPSGPVGPTPTTTTQTLSEALSYLHGKTSVPILVPSAVSDSWGKAAVLSATAKATNSTYEVGLYRCAPPQPLNDPAVGNASCSGNAQFYGFFGGQIEPSVAAAQAALPNVIQVASTAVSCTASASALLSSVELIPGVAATLTTCPGSPNPEVVTWTQQSWTIVEAFGAGGTPDWRTTARGLASQMASHPLPTGPGLFEVQVAGDGNHSELGWAAGSTVYTVYNDHSELDVATVAAAMRSAS